MTQNIQIPVIKIKTMSHEISSIRMIYNILTATLETKDNGIVSPIFLRRKYLQYKILYSPELLVIGTLDMQYLKSY